MNKNWRVLLLLEVIFASACSDTLLLKPKEKGVNVQSKGDFCTQPPELTDQYTKFLFVIDKSGSNVIGNLGGPGTDPQNKKRADNIEKFWLSKKNNKYIKWGVIAFHDWQADSYIGTDAAPIFSSDPKDMQNALNRLRSDPDQNSTPYQAALLMAQKIVKNDLEKHPEEDSQYSVFFISDGYPDDGNVTHPVSAAEIAMVDGLMDAAKDRIHFSTAYYGPADAKEAAEGLSKMAERGQGKFVDMNQASDFNIDDLIVGGPTAETYTLKPGSFVVYNVNSAICFNGNIGADSDGDSLCDRDELSLGSPYDIQNRFSFNDGYGDLIHYEAQHSHTTLLPCQDRSDADNDLLTACEETYMKNSNPSGTAKFIGDPKNPDTDGDGIIDGIEFFMLHNKSAPLDAFNLLKNYDTEKMNAGNQIRQHRNPLYPDNNLDIEDVYDTNADFSGYTEDGQSCYNYNQKYLKAYFTRPVSAEKTLGPSYAHQTNENVILIYFIEALQREPNSPGVYAYSLQTVNHSHAKLNVNNQAFKLYKVPIK